MVVANIALSFYTGSMSNKSSRYSSPTVDVRGFTGVVAAELLVVELKDEVAGTDGVVIGVALLDRDGACTEERGVVEADPDPVPPALGVLCPDEICWSPNVGVMN